MSYDTALRISGWIDIALGISGGAITLFYDLMMHRNWRLGIWAWVTLIVCAAFIYKGWKQLELVD